MDDPRARDLLERCVEELTCPQSVISIREPCDVCKLKDEVRTYLTEPERGRDLLERLLKWDHFDAAGDGAYWRAEILAVLREPERGALALERRVDVIESAQRFYEQAKTLRHQRFYEQAKATGLLLEHASEAPKVEKD